MKLNVISVQDFGESLEDIIDSAQRLKKGALKESEPLKGKTLAMIFEKASTRTRVSFEVAMTQLGGHAIFLSPNDIQIGRGETISDTAKVLSRMVDCIMYRAYKHDMMLELATNATVPVISALDELEHPCQAVADLMTIKEQKGKFKGVRVAYLGDGNNVCNSLMLGSAMVGMNFIAACPKGYEPDAKLFRLAGKIAMKKGGSIKVVESPSEAATKADVLYTDTWVSMGMEDETMERERVFKPYQLNSELLKKAKRDCIVLHCLPAHRGHEITDEVMDGPRSFIFDQSENRLHTEKAILLTLMH
ncbi:MAG: ornithine carbamoyltransferase [Methanomassiliicoccales archaeon]|nr:ornithine carbamoyltransferase [Methanomassiliicoccales archaeon]